MTSPPRAPSITTEPEAAPRARLVQGIAGVDAATWDALAGTGDPFVGHAFLAALERSGSAGAGTGWLPVHVVVDEGGEVVGAAPLYLKSHSFGEYVFDHAWADAYERAGGRYYPKLQCAVPFTPVPGRRLLARDDSPQVRRVLAGALAGALEQLDASSAHVTYCTAAEAGELESVGLLHRLGVQYHWHNRGYGCFEDFLAVCSSARRKTMRKERARVREAGVTIEALHGGRLEPAHLEAFYPFYLATVDKRWGNAYLTRAFFRELAERLAERVVLVAAYHDGRMVAGALNLIGEDALYGRLWGCQEDFRFLHFEACYYAAIDFAIEHGVARVEAGAQGMHKLQRGYEPVLTHSAHLIADPGLRRAVADYLRRERRHVRSELDELRELLPFKEKPG